MATEKPKTQLDYAFTTIEDALRKFNAQAFLGLDQKQIGSYLHIAREEALAVDVDSIDDEQILIDFIARQQKLLRAIRELNAEKRL